MAEENSACPGLSVRLYNALMKVLTRIHYDAILSFRFVCQEIKRNEKTMRSFFTYGTDCTLKVASKKPVISGSTVTLYMLLTISELWGLIFLRTCFLRIS